MPQSRMSQVSLLDTPYYHCDFRCVCRSFRCGVDHCKFSSEWHTKYHRLEQQKLLSRNTISMTIAAVFR